MNIERPILSYHDFIFLSPTLILLPNCYQNTLDIWVLPNGITPAPIEPFLSLFLPCLYGGSEIIRFCCHREPNPMPSGTPHSEAPFHPDPEDAMVVLNAQISTSPNRTSAYSLFVYRKALLRVVYTNDQPEDDNGAFHYVVVESKGVKTGTGRVRIYASTGNISLAEG
ncbi:hypothetical protein H2248_008068 [Termitomyces sp. 'cryptogamus']|nr:hypothetical protein H2248_008068 [Termitomyces sp. 'cryptogamus']